MTREKLSRIIKSPYFISFALWAFFSVLQVGYDSPDEHYPTLEAAGGLIFGYWNHTWEWGSGLRSWIQPFMAAAVIGPVHALGVENRLWLDSIARLFNSVWALGSVWAMGELARVVWRGDKAMVRSLRYWVAVSWPLVVWGTRHGLDNFGIPPLLAGFAVLLTATNPMGLLSASALLGLAFCLRYTLALPILAGVIGWYFLQPEPKGVSVSRIALVATGMIVSIGGLELLDAALWVKISGRFFFPPWVFFKFNILQKSGIFEASPWYLLILYSLLFWVPPLGWLVYFQRNVRKNLSRPGLWPLVVLIFTVGSLSWVSHKELRFIYPVLPFAILATVPLLRGNLRRVAWIGNAVMLILSAILYSDPHGGLVRGLDEATRIATSAENSGLALAGITGGIPFFYMRKPLKTIWLDDEEWVKVCGGDFALLNKKEAGPKKEWIVIAQTACSTLTPQSACQYQSRIPVGPGYRLRQLISKAKMPQYVYRCAGT